MRILIISDIHANLTAFKAVLADAGAVDSVWCLGDVVGYGPDPNECIELLQEQSNLTCIMGNHDAAALGRMPVVTFNGDARLSIEWQKKVLSQAGMDFLDALPETPQKHGDVTLVHGSPRDPIWEYIINTLSARLNFGAFDTKWCFVGHSHLPLNFVQDSETERVVLSIPRPGEKIELRQRAILNPGSVGQPRDRDPRAAYAIFYPEKRTWESHRVEYDIESVQARIRKAGLPEKHAIRLTDGW
jgi:diadenosine tetraphosphatase ApaH/serine/threonine PP2A family protein phosphatase